MSESPSIQAALSLAKQVSEGERAKATVARVKAELDLLDAIADTFGSARAKRDMKAVTAQIRAALAEPPLGT